MTAAEWDNCDDPAPMLEFLRGRVSDREVRLFACACCRTIDASVWRQLLHGPDDGPRAIATAERYADGLTDARELEVAERLCWDAIVSNYGYCTGLGGEVVDGYPALQAAFVSCGEPVGLACVWKRRPPRTKASIRKGWPPAAPGSPDSPAASSSTPTTPPP